MIKELISMHRTNGVYNTYTRGLLDDYVIEKGI